MVPHAAGEPLVDGVDLAPMRAQGGRIGLAVSGGGDSTALAVLAAEALGGERLVILTLDHGLRADAKDDVAAVKALGARLGIQVVAGIACTAPRGSLQAWARRERYAFFAEMAERHGLSAVALGHTLDDQAETFLLRLARGSGLRGLAAMRPDTEMEGIRLLRPLLGATRDSLRAALSCRGVSWREDVSNADARFDRTVVRALLPRLGAIGLTRERLAATTRHLARASEAVDAMVRALLANTATAHRDGAVTLDRAQWETAPREVRLRALAAVIQAVGGDHAPPRFSGLERLETALLEGGAPMTLGHTVVVTDGGHLRVWREARDIAPLALAPGETGVFDGRYRAALHQTAPDAVVIDALGEDARALPLPSRSPAMATAPGVFVDGVAVAAPTLGVRARCWPRDAITLTHVR